MRLAVYHPWLKEKGGAERVVLEIAKRSSHEVVVYTLFYDPESTFEEFNDINVREMLDFSSRGFVTKGIIFAFGSALTKIPDNYDILLVSESGLGCLKSLREEEQVFCYCHTPLRVFLPEFMETYRKEFPVMLRPFYNLMKKFYSFWERKAWGKFKHVFANSKTTRDRILEKDLTSKDNISILNPGIDFRESKKGEYRNYFFYPSRFRRYKRQKLAIKAFKEADLEEFKLILAGSAQEEDYIKELKEMSGEKVEIKTDVSEENWRELYANCYAVLFLPEKEDWGIVPVEAASYAKPVIAVNEGGPQESVINGETGFLVDSSISSVSQKIEELAKDREKAALLGNKGFERSKQYSWSNFIERLDQKLAEAESD